MPFRHCPFRQAHFRICCYDAIYFRKSQQAVGPQLLLVHPSDIRTTRTDDTAASVELDESTRRFVSGFFYLQSRENISIGKPRVTVRKPVRCQVFELARQLWLSRIPQIDDERLSGSPAVSEQSRIRRKLVLGMMWKRSGCPDRQCCDDLSVSRRTGTSIDHREEIGILTIAVAGPDKEVRALRINR